MDKNKYKIYPDRIYYVVIGDVRIELTGLELIDFFERKING
jgi:hypothetical protein